MCTGHDYAEQPRKPAAAAPAEGRTLLNPLFLLLLLRRTSEIAKICEEDKTCYIAASIFHLFPSSWYDYPTEQNLLRLERETSTAALRKYL